MNIMSLLRVQIGLILDSTFRRSGSVADLEADLGRIVRRSRLLSERNNERANVLESQQAAIQDEIERLDAEVDEAQLIELGARRLLGQ
jgi:peptidoglycan hydrolase CwlO-like protein